MAITGFEVFRRYQAAKLHFTTDHYDIIASKSRVKATKRSFNAREDKAIFEHLGTKFETVRELNRYLFANFAYQNNNFLYQRGGDMAAYREWMRRRDAITEIFKEDTHKILRKLEEEFKPAILFKSKEGSQPTILTMFMEQQIRLESLRIFEDLHPYIHTWEKDGQISNVWKDEIRVIRKLNKLVVYDGNRIKRVWSEFIDNVESMADERKP